MKEISMKKAGLDRTIELQEFKEHVSNEEPWFIVDGEVYDGAGYLKDHPGGAQSILSAVGTNATEDFLAIRELLIKTPQKLRCIISNRQNQIASRQRP